MNDVKPTEGEDEILKPKDGDVEEELVDDFFEEDEEDEQETKDEPKESDLDQINKATGKKFTQEQLVEYIKKVDKDYAQKNVVPVKDEPKEVTPDISMSERLLKLEQPESKHVIDMIKKDHPGEDPYEWWNKSDFYKQEATARSAKEKAETRMTPPSNHVEEQEEDSEEKKMSQKFMRNFPPGTKEALKKQGIKVK